MRPPRSASLTADKQLLQCWAEKLAKALNVNYVFIGEYDERGMGLPATVAFYDAGAVIGQEQDYYRATHCRISVVAYVSERDLLYE